jgi:hypothetical protein
VTATLALLVALGGTSYAVTRIGSREVVDNSLRSRDIRNNALLSNDIRDGTIRGRDVHGNALGSRVIKESTLGIVPRAADADHIGGVTAQDLKLRCPPGTLAKTAVCIETAPRTPNGFLTAVNQCEQAGRELITMPQLDAYARSNGPLSQAEWTANVYRNPDNGPSAVEQLETVLLSGLGDVSFDRVYLAVQHAFRCVALPSN